MRSQTHDGQCVESSGEYKQESNCGPRKMDGVRTAAVNAKKREMVVQGKKRMFENRGRSTDGGLG